MEATETHVQSDEVLESAFGVTSPDASKQQVADIVAVGQALSNMTAFNPDNKQATTLAERILT